MVQRLKTFFYSHCCNQLAPRFQDYVIDFAITEHDNKVVVIELNPFLETTDGCLFSWTKERHLLEGSQRTVTCTDGASPDAVGGVATTVATAVPGTEAHGEGDPLFRVRFTPERGAKSLLARDWRELLEARNGKVAAAAAAAAAPSPSTRPRLRPQPEDLRLTDSQSTSGNSGYRIYQSTVMWF